MSDKYILKGKTPIPCEDLTEWAVWFNDSRKRVVKQETVALCPKHVVFVSTVFLGLDHNFLGGGGPILFETMVFGGELDLGTLEQRYPTWEEAEKGHAYVIDRIKEAACKA